MPADGHLVDERRKQSNRHKLAFVLELEDAAREKEGEGGLLSLFRGQQTNIRKGSSRLSGTWRSSVS